MKQNTLESNQTDLNIITLERTIELMETNYLKHHLVVIASVYLFTCAAKTA